MRIFFTIFLLLLMNQSWFGQGVKVSTDKLIYHYRDSIHIYVYTANMTEDPVTLEWGSTCQASYTIIDNYNWLNDHVCYPTPTELTLEPNQSHRWSFTYREALLSPGEYKLAGEVLGYGKSDTIAFMITDEVIAYYSATVSDPNNYPITNVSISAEGSDYTFTNDAGKFTLQFTSLTYAEGSSSAYPVISYHHPDYKNYSETIMLSKGDSIAGHNVILTPKGKFAITGHVNYDNNEPIPGVTLGFYGVNNSSWNYTTTDSKGNYTIKINQDSFYVYAWVSFNIGNASTFRVKYYNNKSTLSEADLLTVNKDINEINFTFPVLHAGTISGIVKDQMTQQPLKNAWIMVSSAEPGDSTGLETDQNGIYSIQVFEGEYILFVDKMGYHMQFYKDAYNIFDATPVMIDANNLNVTGIDFYLTKPEPGTNIISGIVKDAASYQQLSNVNVYAIPLSGGNSIVTKSDYKGYYSLTGIIDGEYTLLYNKPGYTSEFYQDVYEWENAFVIKLTGNLNIKLDDVLLTEMSPFGGEISGRISSNLGSNLSGTLISAINQSDSVISTSFSAHDGSYTISSIINGDYTIKASKVGYKTSEYSGKIKIEMNNQPAVKGIDIAIKLTGIENKGNEIPAFFDLYQNYPNPFNPATTIKYGLPKESKVQLAIYNILGEKVEVLVNSFQKAGRYEVNWNAKDFASGVYIYQLRAENFSQSRKLILMK